MRRRALRLAAIVALAMLATPPAMRARPARGEEVKAPECAQCKDIPKLEKELAQQKLARDAFREFTYDSVGPRQRAGSIQELQVLHAALFSQMASGGKKGGGKRGRVVAKAALETDPNDSNCTIYEVRKDGKKVPLDEAQYRKKLCLFADYLIAHEKHHEKKCKRAYAEGLRSSFEDPVFVAELEVQAYQEGIDVLESQLASLKGRCFVAASGIVSPSDRALALGLPDAPAIDGEAKRLGSALRKGWS